MVDVILRGGTVIDGTAALPADVAIAGDRIAAVGPGLPKSGEIDVSGKIVAPGFIDVHTHDDRALFATPGHGGEGQPGRHHRGHRQLRRQPRAADAATSRPPPPLDLIGDARPTTPIRVSPITCDALDRSPPAINAACLVGHSTLRVGAMPDSTGRPRDDEIAGDGRAAAGGARCRRDRHVDRARSTPRPSQAPPAEIEALAARLRPAGALYTTHMRDEAEHVLDSLDESFACRPSQRGCRW